MKTRIKDRLDIYGPASCPWCGLHKQVYVRAESELVCTDCSLEAQAREATFGDGLPEGNNDEVV